MKLAHLLLLSVLLCEVLSLDLLVVRPLCLGAGVPSLDLLLFFFLLDLRLKLERLLHSGGSALSGTGAACRALLLLRLWWVWLLLLFLDNLLLGVLL